MDNKKNILIIFLGFLVVCLIVFLTIVSLSLVSVSTRLGDLEDERIVADPEVVIDIDIPEPDDESQKIITEAPTPPEEAVGPTDYVLDFMTSSITMNLSGAYNLLEPTRNQDIKNLSSINSDRAFLDYDAGGEWLRYIYYAPTIDTYYFPEPSSAYKIGLMDTAETDLLVENKTVNINDGTNKGTHTTKCVKTDEIVNGYDFVGIKCEDLYDYEDMDYQVKGGETKSCIYDLQNGQSLIFDYIMISAGSEIDMCQILRDENLSDLKIN